MKFVANSFPIIGVWSATRFENPGKTPRVRVLSLGSNAGPVHKRRSSWFIKSSILLELMSVALGPRIPRDVFNFPSGPIRLVTSAPLSV
ncbi:hypothetical protein D3C71_1074980 [compost metagenome]